MVDALENLRKGDTLRRCESKDMINIMKLFIRYTIAVMSLVGCSEERYVSEPAPVQERPIQFGITNGAATRSMVGKPGADGAMEDGMMTLQDMCTPSVGGRAISVLGDYYNDYLADNTDFVSVFKNSELTYDPSLESERVRWTYDGGDRYWQRGCLYRFRSYFPSIIEPISSSTVATLSLEYPSNRIQEDLLVAYNEADTGDADFNSKDPVELYFRHTLAALKFKFELDYANTDMITAVWFENSQKEDFAVGGILFCERREAGGRIFSSTAPPKESELDQYFQWLKGYCPEPKVDQFYKWTCSQNVDGSYNGQPLESRLDENNILQVEQSAYAYECTPDMTASGEMFTRNGGWLLIIPQRSSGNLQLCFQTEHGGNTAIFRVAIPKYTGHMIDDEGRYVDAEGNVVATASEAAQYDRWRAGKRYTYTIKIRKSNLSVSLAVVDWDVKYSSTQIEF